MNRLTSDTYALHRPELLAALTRGDREIDKNMEHTPRRFRARQELAVQGDPLAYVFRLHEGWCARVRSLPDGRAQIITVSLPGDLVGLKGMFLAEQLDAIYALSDVTALAVEQSRLREAMRTDPDVATRITFQLVDEERRLHNRVVRLGQADAGERVAAMLVSLRARLVRAKLLPQDARAYRLPMTQVQIADFLGLTPVHVNRVFRRLREEGLAKIGSGLVDLLDLDRLARLALPVQDTFERAAPR